MNSTIDYYNSNAVDYFENTLQVDLDGLHLRFLAYVPEGGRIMDLGCGSGRDVKWFSDHGYDAYGLDASSELVELASNVLGVKTETGLIEEWVSEVPFDGIWCCASLMHLSDSAIKQFLSNLRMNLASDGAVFISVKSGVDTGMDCRGRYFRNFTEDEIRELIRAYRYLSLEEIWYTEDSLERKDFRWLNVILTKNRENDTTLPIETPQEERKQKE